MQTRSTASGFTVIELLALTVLLVVIGAVFWTQKSNIETAYRDDKRKVSINALYYSLEKVYKPTNHYYPRTLSPETLPSVDKELFKDPNGILIGESGSDFRYEPTNCTNGNHCQNFTLRADLENEADYVKKGSITN